MSLIPPREAFPVANHTVSVIIPVFNGLDYTRRCIERLLEDRSSTPFELIVVDNGSTDGVEKWLNSHQDKINLVRPLKNIGFARANNLGSQKARGEFLLFLNNDTLPTEGWLDRMVETLTLSDQTGAVGCKLLYPQTKLVQHAGVAIEAPLAVQHVYEFFPEDHPAVSRRRQFQAVTAACMLMRGELYRKLGGFDEQFVNGYEDLDLCFRINDAGFHIIYEPGAVVFHFAGMSSGRKDHEVENGRLLYGRWFGRIKPDIESIVSEDGYQYSRDGQAGAIKPKNVDLAAELSQARTLFQAGRLTAALASLKRLYYLAPHSHEAISYLERIYMKLGDWDEAWQMGQRLALFKPSGGSLLRLAECALKRGGYESARRYAEGVLDLIAADDTRVPEALAISGDAAFKGGDLAAAKKSYIQGLASDGRSARCLVGVGAIALAEGHYADARSHFFAATDSAPHNARASLGLGLALEGIGDRVGAASAFRRAFECDPDNGGALASSVRTFSSSGNNKQALLLTNEYLNRWPGDPEALALIAELQIKAGEESLAKAAFEQLKSYAPEHPRAVELAGKLNGANHSAVPA